MKLPHAAVANVANKGPVRPCSLALLPRVLSGCLVSCALLASTFASAATDPLVENLDQMVTAGRYAEAYELSMQNMAAYEGDPEFDFLFGLAAMETGRPHEAVFAFERIVFIYPDEQRVKLELGRALFMVNNLTASRQMFEEVLATNPEENVRTNIQAFLALIDEREQTIAGSFNWFVSSGIGRDSNINSATELGVISTPIGDIELSPNGQGIEDNYFDLGTGMAYIKPLSKTSALNFGASYSNHNNIDTDAFDIGVLSGDASYSHVNDNLRFSYGARAQRVDLDGENFQNSASLITTVQRSPGDGWTQSLTGAYTAVRYDDGFNQNASLRDVNQFIVSGVIGKAVGSFFHSMSVYYGDEQAVETLGKNNAQQFYGVAFAEQIQMGTNHVPYFRISLHQSDNKAPDPIFNIEREDKTFSTSLGWIWRPTNQINLTTDVTYTTNDSNLELFEYDRVKYQTGLRYQF